MLNRFERWLRRLGAPADAAAAAEPTTDAPLAACALLVETAVMDGEFAAPERQTIEALLAARFTLSEQESAELVADAERAVAESPQIFRFTNAVNAEFSAEERVALVEMLWEVAYADGVIHAYEENLLRRIGGLIYVSDRDRGEARRRVRARLAGETQSQKPGWGEQSR